MEGLEDYQSITPKNSPIGSNLLEDLYEILDDDLFMDLRDVMYVIVTNMTVAERLDLIQYILHLQEVRRTLNFPDYPATDLSLLQLQSEEIQAGSTITDNSNVAIPQDPSQEVIVRYLDETPGTNVAYPPITDKTFHGDFVEDHGLSQYLSRPLSIATITWAEGAKLNTTLQPWDLFFNNLQVRKKIDYFSRLTCNLHVKAIINASPFYYGAGLISYQPLPSFTNGTISASLTTNGDAHICALSQQPHFWIYPQTNQGGEMTLPYLNYRNWIHVGARVDFQNFGSLTIQSPTALLNANSVVGAGVTLQVYAWATDVKLCGPTTELALQAEEYGVISGPASAVAKVAKSLSATPLIGPYAKATEMVASGVGAIAKLFGFTNAPIMEDVRPLKNLPFHAFSSCEVSQPIDKLSIDPKNELSIDSRVCGHNGIDELLITNFIQRESYLLQATWTAAHTTGQVLIRSNVTPDLKITETHTVPYIQGTPMSHVNTLFRFWRGDIIYRFRFICSKFHRGRVKIQWDPQAGIATAVDANLIHTQIVDISSDTDVEFRVPYLSQTMFLRNSGSPNDPTTYNTTNIVNTGAPSSFDQALHNGRIVLSVLTQQTSPVSSADVIILVSARAADNVVFGFPQQPPKEMSLFDLQSEDITDVATGQFNYDETEHYALTTKPTVLDDETFLICMGERITSLRQLLRRTTFHRSQLITAAPSATAQTIYIFNHARMPLCFGYDPNGIDAGTSTLAPPAQVPFNFVDNTFITWISTCFVGFRGSVNWHYNVEDSNFINSLKVTRLTGSTIISSDYKTSIIPSVTSSSAFARSNIFYRDAGGRGTSLINTRTQAGASIQFPMFSQYRMNTPGANTLVLGSTYDESTLDHVRVETTTQPHSANNPAVMNLDFYVNCGTDFNCIFFINVPTWVNYGTVPSTVP